MMNLMQAQAAQTVKSRLAEYLGTISAKKSGRWICPVCGSGTGPNGTPAGHLNEGECTYHCFSCGFHGDIFDLIGRVEGIANKKEIFRRGYELFSIQVNQAKANVAKNGAKSVSGRGNKPAPLSPSADPKRAGQPDLNADRADYTQYFRQCHAKASETDYFALRGISKETVDKFMLGYDPTWRSPKALKNGKNPPASSRIIIPTGRGSYIARATDPNSDPRYKAVKEGTAEIFNKKALREDEPVFIVEGEIDALSVFEAGGQAVALGGIANKRKFIELVKAEPPKSPLILSLDSDEAGQKAQAEIAEALRTQNTPFLERSACGGYKDPNEHLTSDSEAFKSTVRDAQNLAAVHALESDRAAREKYVNEMSMTAQANSFLGRVKSSASAPAIPTGFAELDKVLDDGLHEGLYILGAISSLGKTSFVLQMADQIAQQGQDVLIFSLEMSKFELMAKSVSRLTYQNCGGGKYIDNAKTTRGVMSGKRYENYNADEIRLIEESVHNYEQYADRLFIFEGMGDVGAAQIREVVAGHIKATGKKPVVIIDYLQILAPAEPRATDKQNTDKAVFELKRMSRDFKIPVIGISSLNRANYNAGINMAAFKESGAIEYSSDVLIGLQFASDGEPLTPGDIDRLKSEEVRKIELKVLKNRNGSAGGNVAYDYRPMFNFFEETGRKAGVKNIRSKPKGEKGTHR